MTRANETLTHQGMYNGNISWMETDLKLFKKPQAMLYKYDQLNRITKSRSLEFSNGNYVARTGVKKYDENYSYDANGNILTLNRKDDKADVMDDFNYSYYANSNKLQRHKTTGGTYVYDAIGNLINDNNEGLSITWTPSGKVRSISKNDDKIFFRYDAIGNRTSKIVYKDSKNDITTYVRDASGNVMAIYRNDTVKEVPIYGSSRIGEYMGKEREGYQTFNLRKYELSNHLGNVLAVISDKVKLYGSGRKVNNQIVADSVRATVVSASDYYPGGLAMKGRQFNANQYRYGFNSGSEKDDEISGRGNHFTTFFREGDTRLLTWWSPDPMANEQPWQSSYSYMDGNPILKNDPTGDYSRFGALWRSGFGLRGTVYQSGEEGNRKVWGFNTTSDGVAHFGEDARTSLKNSRTPQSDEIANRASQAYNEMVQAQMTDIERIKARGGDGIEPFYFETWFMPVPKGLKGLSFATKASRSLYVSSRIIQRGGNTISNSTLKVWKLSKEQAYKAIHAFKKEMGLSNKDHTIFHENGNISDSKGNVLGNIHNFVH